MRLQRLLILGSIIALALLIILANLGAKGTSSKEMTLYIGSWAASTEEAAMIEKQLALYKQSHPNIDVIIEVCNTNYSNYIQSNIASGTEPDVFYLPPDDVATYASRGLVLPLNDYVPRELLDDFYPTLLEGFTWNGKVYGLPKDFNTMVLYYNKEMFASVGYNHPPATWDEWLDVSAKLATAGKQGRLGKNFRVPMLISEGDQALFTIVEAGGTVYNGKTNRLEFNSPQAKTGFEFLYGQLLRKYHYADQAKNLGAPSGATAFLDRKVAMFFSGGWEIPGLAHMAPDWDYGIAVLPKGVQKGGVLFTNSYGVGKNTKHPKEAAELVAFLVGRDSLRIMTEVGLAIPPLQSLAAEFVAKYPKREPLVAMTPYCITGGQYGKKSRLVQNEITRAIDRIIADKNSNISTELDKAYANVKASDREDPAYNWQ